MAPQSSDGEVKDGSSSDLELTEHMETSTGVALSLLGKRRAENSSPDDSGESEQISTGGEGEDDGEDYELEEDEDELEEDGGEEIYRNQEDKELKWGYDSFDGRVDDSSNLRVYSDEEFEMQCRYYKQQLIETKGFFETSDRFPPYVYSGGVAYLGDLEKPAMLGLNNRQACEKMVSICLKRYNEDEDKNVKLDHIVRANISIGSMPKFYITFAARENDSPDASPVEYQAKAAWSYSHEIYPILCRPSPTSKRAMEEMS